MKMKVRVPLMFKVVPPIFLLVGVILSFSGLAIYRDLFERWQNETNERLESASQLIAADIDMQSLSSIQSPQDSVTSAYEKVTRQLRVAAHAAGVESVSLYFLRDGAFYYWVDSEEPAYGYPFFYATPQHFLAVKQQTQTYAEYVDEYGSWRAFLSPITVKMPDGQIRQAIVEVCASKESMEILQSKAQRQVFFILGFGILGTFLVGALVSNIAIRRPIVRLKNAAMTLAAGELGYTVDMHSNDEFGELADSFNKMSQEIWRLHSRRLELERLQRNQEKEHLHELVALAARISDKINSPLCTFSNTIDLLDRRFREPQKSMGDAPIHERRLIDIWTRSAPLLQDALRSMAETSKLLEELRERGHGIETTMAMKIQDEELMDEKKQESMQAVQ